MSLALAYSRARTGVHAPEVRVEVYLAGGLPDYLTDRSEPKTCHEACCRLVSSTATAVAAKLVLERIRLQ